MAVACKNVGGRGKKYLAGPEISAQVVGSEKKAEDRVGILGKNVGLTAPNEDLPPRGTLGFRVQAYGYMKWSQLFTPRQLLSLLTFTKYIQHAHQEMLRLGYQPEQAKAVVSYLGLIGSGVAGVSSTVCTWQNNWEVTKGLTPIPAFPMVWDFSELNTVTADQGWSMILKWQLEALGLLVSTGNPVSVFRGSATSMPIFSDGYFDAVITDPPYYDNIPYAALSDFFYVWLKRSIGSLYSEHFASELTPKKTEVVADPVRFGGKERAWAAYEDMLTRAFSEAHRVLKPNAPMICVYAHKSAAGWSSLVNALRKARFSVVEAWPVETEKRSRRRAQKSAALASTIFIVTRRRDQLETGQYDLIKNRIVDTVKERVEMLWGEGVTGADLVIAALGAGLSWYSRFDRVEYSNGEEVPTIKFFEEVEGIVHELILERLGLHKAGVSAVDKLTRMYVLWRYAYGQSEVPSGEAIVFGYAQNVELDGVGGLAGGTKALLEKKSNKYRLLDYSERGQSSKLGLAELNEKAPIIDTLHRILWLMDNQPGKLAEYLDESRPNMDLLKMVAQVLGSPALKGTDKESSVQEKVALEKLLSHWSALVENKLTGERVQLSLSDFQGGLA